jgi:hypothetical protein
MGYLWSSFSFSVDADLKEGLPLQLYWDPLFLYRETGGQFIDVPGLNVTG